MIYIEIYLLIGILIFLFLELCTVHEKPVVPLAFYTIGLVMIVILWPLFMMDVIEEYFG